MKSRLVTRSVLAPAVFLSMLVLAVGVVAARYVQQLQRSNADVMAREVASMLAAEDLNVCMREFRHQLNLFLRDGQQRHLQAVPALRADAQSLLAKAERLSRANHERELIDVVNRGAHAFFNEYDRILRSGFFGRLSCRHDQAPRGAARPGRADSGAGLRRF